ncbi:unnamed protein product, partial [Amoebophrya sp. A120]|eukprot:GSA120T00018903001.1
MGPDVHFFEKDTGSFLGVAPQVLGNASETKDGCTFECDRQEPSTGTIAHGVQLFSYGAGVNSSTEKQDAQEGAHQRTVLLSWGEDRIALKGVTLRSDEAMRSNSLLSYRTSASAPSAKTPSSSSSSSGAATLLSTRCGHVDVDAHRSALHVLGKEEWILHCELDLCSSSGRSRPGGSDLFRLIVITALGSIKKFIVEVVPEVQQSVCEASRGSWRFRKDEASPRHEAADVVSHSVSYAADVVFVPETSTAERGGGAMVKSTGGFSTSGKKNPKPFCGGPFGKIFTVCRRSGNARPAEVGSHPNAAILDVHAVPELDGRVVLSASDDRSVRIWGEDSDEDSTGIKLTEEGNDATTATDVTRSRWRLLGQLTGHGGRVTCVRTFDIGGSRSRAKMNNDGSKSDRRFAAIFQDDFLTVTASEDQTVKVWRGCTCLRTFSLTAPGRFCFLERAANE